uniref:Putative secreted protein n=1 Tax=Anopheles marajoara TaxID=58244 RepID=A0A2M4CDH6_9DIPT
MVWWRSPVPSSLSGRSLSLFWSLSLSVLLVGVPPSPRSKRDNAQQQTISCGTTTQQQQEDILATALAVGVCV